MNQPVSSPQAEIPAAVPLSKAAKPGRKDRMFSRGLIAVLLVVLVVEVIAYARMTSMQQRIWSEVQKGERESLLVTRARIDAIVGRQPDKKHVVKASVGEERFDVYYFGGLLKRRELCVHYGVSGIDAEPEVLEVLTSLPEGMPSN